MGAEGDSGGKLSLTTSAEPRQQPWAGRAAEAASGRGLGMAGYVWLWATMGVSFSSLSMASKTTELAAELRGGLKIVTATYHDMPRHNPSVHCRQKKRRREGESKGQELHNIGCQKKCCIKNKPPCVCFGPTARLGQRTACCAAKCVAGIKQNICVRVSHTVRRLAGSYR